MSAPRTRRKSAAESAYEKRKGAAYRKMFADPRFQRLEAKKDAALKAESRAEGYYLSSKREADRERFEAATRTRKRVLRALYRFEDAFLSRERVGTRFQPGIDPYARDPRRRPLRRRRRA